MDIPDDFDETCGILYIPETIEFHEPNDEFLDKLIEHLTKLLNEPLDPDQAPPGNRIPLIVRTEEDLAIAQGAVAALANLRGTRCRPVVRLISYEEWLAGLS